MKQTLKGFVIGFIVATMLAGVMSYAAQTVRIVLNGDELVPTDANGKRVDPIIVEGTTYLPVRAIASALGLEVGWDGETSTVSLIKKEQKKEEIKEETTEEPAKQGNVIEGMAQVITNNRVEKTSELQDEKTGKIYIADRMYTLGEWGSYKVVNGTLVSFEIIDHYGWTKGNVVKTGWNNLEGPEPRFQLKLDDDTILTITDRKVKINSEWYNTRIEEVTEGLYRTMQLAIGVGEIWYKTDEKGYITRIETIR